MSPPLLLHQTRKNFSFFHSFGKTVMVIFQLELFLLFFSFSSSLKFMHMYRLLLALKFSTQKSDCVNP